MPRLPGRARPGRPPAAVGCPPVALSPRSDYPFTVSLLRCALLAHLLLPGTAAGQLPDRSPPEPPAAGADLSLLAAWIERWLPTVAAVSGSALDSTGDFYSRASDSVMAAGLDGCTLVLQERSVSLVRGWREARYSTVYVPLGSLDTALVTPKIRRPTLLLERPNLLLYGQLVIPLRNRARTEFITVLAAGDLPVLVREHQVPLVFQAVPAARSAQAIREAAVRCGAGSGTGDPVP